MANLFYLPEIVRTKASLLCCDESTAHRGLHVSADGSSLLLQQRCPIAGAVLDRFFPVTSSDEKWYWDRSSMQTSYDGDISETETAKARTGDEYTYANVQRRISGLSAKTTVDSLLTNMLNKSPIGDLSRAYFNFQTGVSSTTFPKDLSYNSTSLFEAADSETQYAEINWLTFNEKQTNNNRSTSQRNITVREPQPDWIYFPGTAAGCRVKIHISATIEYHGYATGEGGSVSNGTSPALSLSPVVRFLTMPGTWDNQIPVGQPTHYGQQSIGTASFSAGKGSKTKMLEVDVYTTVPPKRVLGIVTLLEPPGTTLYTKMKAAADKAPVVEYSTYSDQDQSLYAKMTATVSINPVDIGS